MFRKSAKRISTEKYNHSFKYKPTCDISQATVVYASKELTCDTVTTTTTNDGFIVTGEVIESDNKNIQITLTDDENLDIILSSLKIVNLQPMVIDGTGTVIITLEDKNTLTSSISGSGDQNNVIIGGNTFSNYSPALYCKSGTASITIQGNGELYAQGIRSNPGIGTDKSCHTIAIHGGYVVATGSDGEYSDNSEGTTETDFQIFQPENPDATQYIHERHYLSSGAGIGTGTYGTIEKIEIGDESTVISTGGKYAAGIGAGMNGYVKAIEISSKYSLVKSTGGNYGAAIGAGLGGRKAYDTEKYSHVDSITITNGEVNTFSSTGAGIGAGYGGFPDSAYVGTISISGGVIVSTISTDGTAAAIGGGTGYDSDSAYVGSLIITGGLIVAKGSTFASAIGPGYNYKSNNNDKASSITTTFKIKDEETTLQVCAITFKSGNAFGDLPDHPITAPTNTPDILTFTVSNDEHFDHFRKCTYYRSYYPAEFGPTCSLDFNYHPTSPFTSSLVYDYPISYFLVFFHHFFITIQ